MSLYSRFVRRFGGTRWFAAAAARVAPPLDRLVYRLSGKRRIAVPSSIPTLFLTTVGRRSGEPRTHPLSFIETSEGLVVVGTNFGQAHHPGWTANLLADPMARVEYLGESWQVRATLIPSEDHAAHWPIFDAMLPSYAAYRARLTRPVRMFRLERA